jgi:hypothetical protein
MVQGVVAALAWEQDGKFFTSVAVRLATTGHLTDMLGHHSQNLVSDVVPVLVVELFEVVDIHHRDAVLITQLWQCFVERAPRRQPRQAVPVRHEVRCFDNADCEDQTSCGEIGLGRARVVSRMQCQERCGECPEETARRGGWTKRQLHGEPQARHREHHERGLCQRCHMCN